MNEDRGEDCSREGNKGGLSPGSRGPVQLASMHAAHEGARLRRMVQAFADDFCQNELVCAGQTVLRQ